MIRYACGVKLSHGFFNESEIRRLVYQHSFHRKQRSPEFLVGEMSPHESHGKQPRIAHAGFPANLAHVSSHVCGVTPCLYSRLRYSHGQCRVFLFCKRLNNLAASAIIEASAVFGTSSAAIAWDAMTSLCDRLCRLCSTTFL